MHRSLCLTASLTTVLLLGTAPPARAAKSGDELISDLRLLFVQSAHAGSFDGTRLTLDGVGATLFFSDRPARVSGHLETAKYLGAWGEGPDSFAADPPNATLSILDGGEQENAVVELSDPKQSGGSVSYAVKVVEGKIPAKFGPASLFIDHGHAGGYVAAGLGGAILGGALVHASDESKPKSYSAPNYYYTTAAPPPCVCNCK